jgi:arylsulfatase A-like enzyme
LWGHGHDLHEPVLRVPLLVKFPDGRHAARSNMRVSHEQIFTLVDRMSSGVSEQQVLAELGRPEPRVVAESWITARMRNKWPKDLPWYMSRAIYDGRWKMIERLGARSELYNLEDDPNEARDLLQAQPEVARSIVSTITAKVPPIDVAQLSHASTTPLDPEVLEHLHALGYVGH